MPNSLQNKEFTTFVKEIKTKILSSQYEALKAVNKELINLYWDMRQFYLEYYENEKLQPLVGEISWIEIMLNYKFLILNWKCYER